jgi:hypothetical protein
MKSNYFVLFLGRSKCSSGTHIYIALSNLSQGGEGRCCIGQSWLVIYTQQIALASSPKCHLFAGVEEEAPGKEIRGFQSQIVSDTLGDDLLSTTGVIHFVKKPWVLLWKRLGFKATLVLM